MINANRQKTIDERITNILKFCLVVVVVGTIISGSIVDVNISSG
jgi:hypothetical protein